MIIIIEYALLLTYNQQQIIRSLDEEVKPFDFLFY